MKNGVKRGPKWDPEMQEISPWRFWVPPWGAKDAKKGVPKRGQKRDPQQIDFLEPEWLPAGRSVGEAGCPGR